MSELIVQWLNHDVGLSKKVGAFERDFANGYLFGELLHKHGYMSQFEEVFVDESTFTAKKENLGRVKAALKGAGSVLGVNLRDEQISEIMNEDRGASLRLLYQLRKGLLQLGAGVTQRKKEAPAKLEKVQHGELEERFFDAKLRGLDPKDPRVGHEVHAKRFVDAHTQHMRRVAEEETKAAQATRDRVQEFRGQRIDLLKEKQAAAKQVMAVGAETWHAVQTRKAASVENDLRFEKEMIRREREKIARTRQYHQQEVGYAQDDESNGVNWFERNLQRIGIDTSEHSGSMGTPIEAESLKELYEKMAEKLPTQAALQIEASKRMKKIREAKRATDVARKERERRQQRVAVEQQATQALVEAQKKEEDELAWLLRVTAEYRKEAAAFDHVLRIKEAERVERQQRQKIRAEKLSHDMDEAYERTATKAREERAQQLDERRLRAANGLLETQAAEDSDTSEADEAPSGAAGGAKRGSRRRSSTKTTAVNVPGSPQVGTDTHSTLTGGLETARPLPPAPPRKLLECVQEPRVSDYLFARGDWAQHVPNEYDLQRFLAAQATYQADVQPRLGGVVRALCSPPKPPPARAPLPPEILPLVTLSGSPVGLGGAAATGLLPALQRRICEEFSFAALDPQKVLQECLTMVRKDPKPPEWPISARMHQLGRSVIDMVAQKGPESAVPPATLAEMLFRKVELLLSPPPKPPEEEVDTKKKKPPPKGKEKKEEEVPAEPPKGILLVGFPIDIGQQAALESALRGYTSPLFRLLDGDEDLQLQLSSVIAPWWGGEQASAPVLPVESLQDDSVAPLRHFRLRHPQQDLLAKAVVAEAVDESLWEVKVPNVEAETVGTDGAPLPVCQGYAQRVARLPSPVDRVWVYEEAQAFASAFAEPLGMLCDVAVAVPVVEEGEAEVSLEEACYRKIREVIIDCRRKAEEAVAAAAAAAAAVAAKADAEAAEGIAAEERGDGERKEDPEQEEDEEEEPHLRSFSADGQARLKTMWEEGLSSYYLGIQGTLAEFHDGVGNYGEELLSMQRNFLEFLQRSDEKPHIFEDFLRSQLQTPGRPQPDELQERLEELSDCLWQLTDRRRADAVQERVRLMTGGFWESQAAASISHAIRLQALEFNRFVISATLLCEAHGRPCPQRRGPEEVTASDGLSSLQELVSWLSKSAARFSGDLLVEAAASEGATRDLVGALLAEQRDHVRRLRTVSAWAARRLEVMREQLDEVFRRMDDWIRLRVKAENDAIKAAIAVLTSAEWDSGDDVPSPSSSMRGTRRSLQMSRTAFKVSKVLSSPSGAARRRKRDFLKALEPRTLDADMFQPPVASKLEVPSRPLQGHAGRATRSLTLRPQAVSTDGWPLEMLCELMECLLMRYNSAPAILAEQLCEVLLECRNKTLRLEAECVPKAWASRSEGAWEALCQAFVQPAWGAVAVDITELLLALTLHGCQMSLPSLEALEAARQIIHSEESGLSDEQLALYPDVPISEAVFLKLGLFDGQLQQKEEHINLGRDGFLRWIFRIVRCFENEMHPQLLTVPGRDRGDGSSVFVTARRLFTYLGQGSTPTDGLRRSLRLLLPRPGRPTSRASEEGEEATAPDRPTELRIRDLHRALFSCPGRPAAAVAPAPDLMQLCKELLPQLYDKEAWLAAQEAAAAAMDPKAKAKAKAKAAEEKKKGKGAAEPPPGDAEEDGPPPPPEEAVVTMAEAALLRHPAVLRALLTHGGPLCFKRAPVALFSGGGAGVLPVVSAEEAGKAAPLQSLLPAQAGTPGASRAGSPEPK